MKLLLNLNLFIPNISLFIYLLILIDECAIFCCCFNWSLKKKKSFPNIFGDCVISTLYQPILYKSRIDFHPLFHHGQDPLLTNLHSPTPFISHFTPNPCPNVLILLPVAFFYDSSSRSIDAFREHPRPKFLSRVLQIHHRS